MRVKCGRVQICKNHWSIGSELKEVFVCKKTQRTGTFKPRVATRITRWFDLAQELGRAKCGYHFSRPG